MIARFGLVQKRADISNDEFDSHWRDVHGPLAARMPGLKRYEQHIIVNKEQFGISENRGAWDLDGISELHFESANAMRDAVADEVYNKALQDEDTAFADVHVVACEKHAVVPINIGKGPFIKRMTLLRKSPGITDEQFRHEWLTVHANLVSQWPDVLGYMQNIVVDRYHKSRTQSASHDEVPVDGIVEFVFRDKETAARLYASEIVARTQVHARQFLAEITPFFVETRRIV